MKAAARKFGYRPNIVARQLQGMNTCTIGILLPEFGEGYHSQVLSGAGADVGPAAVPEEALSAARLAAASE